MNLTVKRTRGLYGVSPTSRMYVFISLSHGRQKTWITQYYAGYSPFTLRVNSTNHFCAKLLIVENCVGGQMLCESEN